MERSSPNDYFKEQIIRKTANIFNTPTQPSYQPQTQPSYQETQISPQQQILPQNDGILYAIVFGATAIAIVGIIGMVAIFKR